MGLLKVCSIIFGALAVLVAAFLGLGSNFKVTKGMIPALVNEIKITEATIPSLTEKVFLVTGANAGLGKSAAKHFAANGATTIMGCRDLKKCKQAKSLIIKEIEEQRKSPEFAKNVAKFKESNLIEMELDLGSFKSIKEFSEKFKSRFNKLDSLILNAGVMHSPFMLTQDGIEQQIGVNHFGHFYLTKLLTPLLEKAQPSTVVVVSSNGQFGSYPEGVMLNLKELNDMEKYDRVRAYGQSKLANVLFAQELAAKFKKEGKKIFVNSMNPGGVNTELLRHHVDPIQTLAKWIFKTFPNKIFFESDYAALTEVYLAVGPDIIEKQVTGKYFVPIGEECDTSDHAKNTTLQKGLWKLSEEILHLKGFN